MGARTQGSRSRWYRGRGTRAARATAAGGALLSVLVLGFGIGLAGPAAGSADRPHGTVRVVTVVSQAAATPTTTVSTTPSDADRGRIVAVSPFSALAPSGAQVTVGGKGFDPAKDLWVAVCAEDGVAPAALIHCIGGAIPDDNQTTGWGIITSANTAPYPGAAVAKWGQDGSFSITLVLPAAIGDAVDCVKDPCAVYTRSSDDQNRTEDVAVPVSFNAPPTTPTSISTSTSTSTSSPPSTSTSTTASSTPTTPTTTSPTAPSTSTIGVSATTVSPNSMLQTTVAVGGSQVVVFSGFTPGESVAVTLFSDPISLPSVTADGSGTVRIEFVVPASVTPGVHVLQAVGSESRRVGVAQFAVVAASSSVTSSATTSSTSASPTTSSVSSPSSSIQTSSAETSAGQASSSIIPSPTTTAITTSLPPGGGSTNNLLWLWITLGVVLVVGATAGIVAMLRARREEEEEPPLVAVGGPMAPTPGWSGGVPPGPPNPPVAPYQGEPARSPGDFGLLSGQEPELLSGRGGPDAPTQTIGPPGPEAPTQYVGPATGGGPAGSGTGSAGSGTGSAGSGTGSAGSGTGSAGSGTGPAGSGTGPAAGPSTQGWSPDFTGQQGTSPIEGEEPPPGPGRHHRDD